MMKTISLKKQSFTDRQKKNLLILETLRREGPLSKAEISKLTKINSPTVMKHTDHYIKDNIVFEKGLDVSDGGRRPMIVELNPHAGYVVGVGLNMSSIVAVLTDFATRIVCEVRKDRILLDNNRETIQEIIDVIEELLNTMQVERGKILGIGLGLPGIIDKDERTIRWPTLLGQKDQKVLFSIPDMFEKRFQIPAIVENDATAAVFGESWLGLERDVKDMIYLYSEVGCGLIIDGKICHGATECAGELGIAKFDATSPDQGDTHGFGRGDMEIGIMAAVKAIPPHERSALLTQLLLDKKNSISLNDIFALAHDGDEQMIRYVKKGGERFGMKIAFLANLLNPEVIVIGGGLEGGKSLLLETIKSTVNEWTMNEVSRDLHIAYSQFGEKAVALGAACIVTQKAFISL